MKKSATLLFFALGLCGRADAVSIGLEFANSPLSQIASVGINMPIDLNFYIQNGAPAPAQAPITQAIGFVVNAWVDAACTIPADNAVVQTSSAALLPGWAVDPTNNNTYLNGLQFAAVSGPNFTVPQGKTYMFSMALAVVDPGPSFRFYITIDRLSSAIIDNTGGDYMTNDAIWYDTGFATAGKAKWGFGNWAGGAWSRYDGVTYQTYSQNANPLILDIPEPSCVMLLVAGAFLLMRRR
jgi:hypothetical protein